MDQETAQVLEFLVGAVEEVVDALPSQYEATRRARRLVMAAKAALQERGRER